LALKLLVVYTCNLRGDEATLIHVLPRLHTLIRSLRSGQGGGVPWNAPATDTRFLRLDLGNSCAPDVWPCDVTGGRSTLIVLDAMGYQAANASHLAGEPREAEDQPAANGAGGRRARLAGQRYCRRVGATCQVALAKTRNAHHPHASGRHPPEGDRLYLAVERGQPGVAQAGLGETATLDERAVLDLPPGTLPDPTIAAAVEFVLGEARYYQGNR
jgi:hypothetical protein